MKRLLAILMLAPLLACAQTGGGFPSRPNFNALNVCPVPPAQPAQTGAIQVCRNGSPTVYLYDSSQASNAHYGVLTWQGRTFLLQSCNDALGTCSTVFSQAVGTGQANFAEPNYGAAGALKNVLTFDSGTFTGQLTGCVSGGAGTVFWTRNGSHINLSLHSTALTCTSNTVNMTMTGLPAALQPANGLNTAMAELYQNNSALTTAQTRIGTAIIGAGVIEFDNCTAFNTCPGASWTAAGTKGLGTLWSLDYDQAQ